MNLSISTFFLIIIIETIAKTTRFMHYNNSWKFTIFKVENISNPSNKFDSIKKIKKKIWEQSKASPYNKTIKQTTSMDRNSRIGRDHIDLMILRSLFSSNFPISLSLKSKFIFTKKNEKKILIHRRDIAIFYRCSCVKDTQSIK